MPDMSLPHLKVSNCRWLSVPGRGDVRGKINFLEFDHQLGFTVRRLFWLHDIAADQWRGRHGHRDAAEEGAGRDQAQREVGPHAQDARPRHHHDAARRGEGARIEAVLRDQVSQIEKLASGIQRQLETLGESEIESKRIGEFVMAGLKALDSVAYIRFASVYKDFSEAKDFEDFAGSVVEAAKK